MLNYTDVEEIFKDYSFPTVSNPICENGDNDKISDYLQKLATDDNFLAEQSIEIGNEVTEILTSLENAEVAK